MESDSDTQYMDTGSSPLDLSLITMNCRPNYKDDEPTMLDYVRFPRIQSHWFGDNLTPSSTQDFIASFSSPLGPPIHYRPSTPSTPSNYYNFSPQLLFPSEILDNSHDSFDSLIVFNGSGQTGGPVNTTDEGDGIITGNLELLSETVTKLQDFVIDENKLEKADDRNYFS